MSAYRTLDDGNFFARRVLLRADLNVPMRDGAVRDETRLQAVLPTLAALSAAGAKTLILSHFGRPKGAPEATFSLRPLTQVLAQHLGRDVGFVANCIGPDVAAAAAAMAPGDVILLENTRFHPGEEANDPAFAKALAAAGDVYINDAFSVAHRAHASTEGLAHLIPAYAGPAMVRELTALAGVLSHPERPLTALIGGAKVSTKIDLLTHVITQVDSLIIGGAMANTFLAAGGVSVGASLVEPDFVETAVHIASHAHAVGCRLILPIDAVVADRLEAHTPSRIVDISAIPAEGCVFDLGPASILAIESTISEAKSLVWNGPLGAFEVPPFEAATMAIARHVAARTEQGALMSVAGGGDTVSALNMAGAGGRLSYTSMAGGAFLEWLEGKTLPGIAALAP